MTLSIHKRRGNSEMSHTSSPFNKDQDFSTFASLLLIFFLLDYFKANPRYDISAQKIPIYICEKWS
jgi:hypothetical protein